MRGTFGGWFEIEDRSAPVKPVIGLVAIAAVLSWLATILWLIAAVLAFLLALAVPGVVLLRRWNKREEQAFLARAEVMHVQRAAKPQVTAASQPPVIVNHHYHGNVYQLHPGADVSGIIQALPDRDAITITEEEGP